MSVRCGECGSDAELVSGAKVYPRRPDLHGLKYWLCRCGAYCGCHPGSSRPLGSPAGRRLRRLRQEVHSLLDPRWQRRVAREGVSRHQARGAVYAWLASELGIAVEETHVGMFSLSLCLAAIEILRAAAERPEERSA